MIKFTCSCGKKYKLQDRIAGREVRCNQCHKTLLVPSASQDEPVIPLEDRREDGVEPTPEKQTKKEVVPAEAPKDGVTEPATEPGTEIDWNSVSLSDSTEIKSDKPKSKDSSSIVIRRKSGSKDASGTAQAAPEPESTPVTGKTAPPKRGMSPVILLLIFVVALGLGIVLGKFIATYSSEVYSGIVQNTPLIKAQQLRAARLEAAAEAPEPLSATEVAEKADKSEGEARRGALRELAKTRREAESKWSDGQNELRGLDYFINVSDLFAKRQADAKTPLGARNELLSPAPPQFTAADWTVSERFPLPFEVRSAGGSAVLISLDGNPVEAFKSDKNSPSSREALSSLQTALGGDNAAQETPATQKHDHSYRIDSDGSDALRVVWPARGEAKLDGNRLKEIRFSLFMPEAAGAKFKPGKPEGIDKTILLASFAVRLYTETGFIEYAPADGARLVALCEKARHDWNTVRIPTAGDDVWTRTDHGLLGPLEIRRIELVAQPTGSGATFWIDNLKLGE